MDFHASAKSPYSGISHHTQQTFPQPVIQHWREVLASFSSKTRMIFLHGLGPDLTSKVLPNDEERAMFEELQSNEARHDFMSHRLQQRDVVRVTFDGADHWDFFASSGDSYLSFHRAVSAARWHCCKLSLLTICQVQQYIKVISTEKPKLVSALGVRPVSRLRLTCLMLACRCAVLLLTLH
jgi:hypothetical protein